MPLRYGLLKNQLRNTHGYVAVTTDVRYVDLEQLIDQMTGNGSTVTKAEILGVWVELEQAITHFVQQGYAVKTPLFSIIPKVTGVFDGPDDTFSPTKHQIKLHIRTTKRLQSLSKKIKVEKIPIETAAPSIASITDLWSGATGHTLTIGQFASVKGKLLKLSPHPHSGIFIIAHDGTVTPVTNVTQNKPSELMFAVPSHLGEGNYRLEVRTQQKNHTSPTQCRTPITLIH